MHAFKNASIYIGTFDAMRKNKKLAIKGINIKKKRTIKFALYSLSGSKKYPEKSHTTTNKEPTNKPKSQIKDKIIVGCLCIKQKVLLQIKTIVNSLHLNKINVTLIV